MNKLTTLNLSFDRVLIQLVTPGLLASFPFVILFFENVEPVRVFFLDDNNGLFVTFLSLIGLITGIILENIGSNIEVNIYDRILTKRNPKFMKIWCRYLLINFEEGEPIGQRYLRNILFRMKFELSSGAALLVMMVGLAIYNADHEIFKSAFLNVMIVYILPIVVSFYLLVIEGWRSAVILAETRKALVKKYYIKPKLNKSI